MTALTCLIQQDSLSCFASPVGTTGDQESSLAGTGRRFDQSYINKKGHVSRLRKLLQAIMGDPNDSSFLNSRSANGTEYPAASFQSMPWVVSPQRNGTSVLMGPNGISTILPRRGGGYNVLAPNGAFTSLSPQPGGGYNIIGANGMLYQMVPRDNKGSYNLIGPDGISGTVLPGENGGYNIIDTSGNWSTIIPSGGTPDRRTR